MDLLLPFQYEFFVNGSIAAVVVGALCGMVGVYVVLRGMSYIGHGLSHAIFGGAVIAFVMQLNFYIGAGLWGFLAALLINQTVRKTRISADAAIGVITTASFAIGIAIISRFRRFTQNVEAALFGNVLGVSTQDVLVILIASAVIALILIVVYKQMLFTAFDGDVARVFGVRVDWMETLFALLLAAALIVSMQILGVTLIAAALVIPAITARLLTDSFNRMMVLSVVIGAACGFFGMLVSFYADIASGAAIVLLQAALFCVALIVGGVRKNAARRLARSEI